MRKSLLNTTKSEREVRVRKPVISLTKHLVKVTNVKINLVVPWPYFPVL